MSPTSVTLTRGKGLQVPLRPGFFRRDPTGAANGAGPAPKHRAVGWRRFPFSASQPHFWQGTRFRQGTRCCTGDGSSGEFRFRNGLVTARGRGRCAAADPASHCRCRERAPIPRERGRGQRQVGRAGAPDLAISRTCAWTSMARPTHWSLLWYSYLPKRPNVM